MANLTRFLKRAYFPAAFLIVIILIVLDGSTSPVVGQIRTVTVTETVRVVTVTVTQPLYVTVERVVTVTVASAMPTTLTSVVRSLSTETSVVSRLMTETSLVSRLMTETSTVSKWITETTAVAAPIQIGPFSLPLYDLYGLRFLGFVGAVALGGFVTGALAARLGRKPALIEPRPQFDELKGALTPEPRRTDGLLSSCGAVISHDGSLSDQFMSDPRNVLRRFGIEVSDIQLAAVKSEISSSRISPFGVSSTGASPCKTVAAVPSVV